MRQRLGIAQALLHRPRLLILDEPMSGLDPIGRREVFEVFQELREDVSILLSTHLLDDAERLCDRVGIIDRGRLVVEASIQELRERFRERFIRLRLEDGAGAEHERDVEGLASRAAEALRALLAWRRSTSRAPSSGSGSRIWARPGGTWWASSTP